MPSPMENTIRITTAARSKNAAEEKATPLIQYIYDEASDFIIGEGKDITLAEMVGQVLRNRSLTISTAESCTGGLLASYITDVPGSSNYMIGGLTAYANSVKKRQLHIPAETIDAYGAVSKETALKMAQEVAKLMDTDIGVSTTGIAGPSGGTEDKPVGTVWVGFWSDDAHFALHTQFSKKRQLNKKRSVALALETVRRTLLDVETMPYGLNTHHV